MNQTISATATAATLDVPGARLYYELRGQGPLVVLAGSPMDATSFAPLADRLATNHTVLTTDPRGINRSALEDPAADSTPQARADDLSRLLAHLDAGPAAVFGSSGGAVTALALAEAHPARAHTVIAHEPPIYAVIDDAADRHAGVEQMIAAHESGDVLGAWAIFMRNANIELPEGALEHMFGGDRDPQAIADERRFFHHELRATTRWQPGIEALRGASTRVVIGVGEESGGELCDRTSAGLADALGTEAVRFPGGHLGFVEAPDAFAARLRPLLEDR